jgi:putative mRNA 3-end processing factor
MNAVMHCLGASEEVGRSAFLLETDRRIMLDYGIKIFDQSGKPQYPLEHAEPDLAVISHAHLDHSGFVPALYRDSRIRWYATPPTVELCEVLWNDSMKIMGNELPYRFSHFKRALKNWNPLLYGQDMHTGDTRIKLTDAGHISGASIVNIEYEGRKICYSGDFKMEETHMHKGAKPVEDVDALILETTYAYREHPPRAEAEKMLISHIEETIADGGTALLPAFSLGRTQELIALVRSFNKDVPIFVDGMGRKMTRIYMRYPKYIKNPNEFKRAVRSVKLVEGPYDRREATERPAVIITSAGMMSGGPVLGYISNVNSHSKVIFTGFCIEESNGWKLLNKGFITMDERDLEVDLPVEYIDLSAHAGRNDLLNFIKWSNPEKIVLVHGDECERFANELCDDFGYDAIAPKIGDQIEL